MEIKYLKGDATHPIGDGNKIIPHICNNENKWGAGFVLALSKRWKEPREAYRNESKYVLGSTTIVPVEHNISVANMIAQNGVINHLGKTKDGLPPIRYDALRECLIAVNHVAVKSNATLHCPRFGAGLAGGDWKTIEQIIKDVVSVDVFVYDFN